MANAKTATHKKGHSPKDISYRMSRIRSKNTSIEVLMCKALFAKGYRYRKHYKAAPGRPDIAFVSAKVAIFCDSSFWHGRNWPQLRRRLRGNRDFWIDKIKRNRSRDRRITRELQASGWLVLRFWEEEIRAEMANCVAEIGRVVNLRNALATPPKRH